MSLEATRREPADCMTCGGTGEIEEENETSGDIETVRCVDCDGAGTIDSEPSCEPEDYIDGDEPSYRRDMIDAGRERLLR